MTCYFWYSRRESNPQRPLRRGLLYPFNYGSILNYSVVISVFPPRRVSAVFRVAETFGRAALRSREPTTDRKVQAVISI